MRTVPALLCGLVLLTADAAVSRERAAAAASSTIRGQVTLPPGPSQSPERASVTDISMAARMPVDRRSVVYLDPAPRAAFDPRDDALARMDQRNKTFVPHVLAILAGTTVGFPNSDFTYHNVFSLSKTKSFDLGRYAVGRSKSVRFDRPGIVRVFCDIHSHMSAFILVFAHRYFAVTDEDGRYRLDGVPPGTYTVMTWNEGSPLDARKVVVPDGGADVEHNVSLLRR